MFPLLKRFLLLFLVLSISGYASAAPQIAIIIDDLGYQKSAGERAIRLPGPVAYAILPHTPRGAYLAEKAHAAGKEVLLHLPLQAENDQSTVGGNSSMTHSSMAHSSIAHSSMGNLLMDMSEQQLQQAFADSLAAVPHATGVNNHRGSLLTRHPGHMRWLMREIFTHGDLFFVDSYTTAASVALTVAIENGVPALRRDVFLDPDAEPATLAREFARLKNLARQNGFAVGIGHPHATTLEFLEVALPELEREGFDLTGIGELVAIQASQAALVAR